MARRGQSSLRERRREEELKRRRADVILAASPLFAEKGFYETQIGEIAAAAELSLKSVYSVFQSKEEIFEAVISTTADRMREAVQGKVQAIPDDRERLLGMIDLLFDCFEQNKDLLRIYARGTQGLPWKTRLAMGRSSVSIFQAFREWVIGLAVQAQRSGYLEGIDPNSLALAIVGTVTTTATHWIEARPSRPLTDAAPGVRALFSKLLG